MHPKEFKREKAATGRLTHLCLASSEIHMGIEFDTHAAVQAIIRDPNHCAVLLYPGVHARDVSRGELTAADLGERRLVVILLDATWSGARKMLKLSPSLQALPRVVITPSQPSRYVIKQQPQEGCLSTLEATHELLLGLERSGLDQYDRPEQMLELFQRMQDFQVRCARDPALATPRRVLSRAPAERFTHREAVGTKRRRYL